jgi:hypothetical protein
MELKSKTGPLPEEAFENDALAAPAKDAPPPYGDDALKRMREAARAAQQEGLGSGAAETEEGEKKEGGEEA